MGLLSCKYGCRILSNMMKAYKRMRTHALTQENMKSVQFSVEIDKSSCTNSNDNALRTTVWDIHNGRKNSRAIQ